MKYEVHWIKAWGMCMGEPYEDEHHGTFNSLDEAQQSVRDWWAKNNYKPQYIRQMADEAGNIWWDYSLHHNFYMFIPVKGEKYEHKHKGVEG